MPNPAVADQLADAKRMSYEGFKGTLEMVAPQCGADTQLTPALFKSGANASFDEFVKHIGAESANTRPFLTKLKDAAIPRGAPNLTPKEMDEAIRALLQKVQGSDYLTNKEEYKATDRSTATTTVLFTLVTQLFAAGNGDLKTLKKWFPPSATSSLGAGASKVEQLLDLVYRCAGTAAFQAGTGQRTGGRGHDSGPSSDSSNSDSEDEGTKSRNPKKKRNADSMTGVDMVTMAALLAVESTTTRSI